VTKIVQVALVVLSLVHSYEPYRISTRSFERLSVLGYPRLSAVGFFFCATDGFVNGHGVVAYELASEQLVQIQPSQPESHGLRATVPGDRGYVRTYYPAGGLDGARTRTWPRSRSQCTV